MPKSSLRSLILAAQAHQHTALQAELAARGEQTTAGVHRVGHIVELKDES